MDPQGDIVGKVTLRQPRINGRDADVVPRCDLALVDGRQNRRGHVQHAIGDAGKGVKDCQWAIPKGYLHHWPAAHIHQRLQAAEDLPITVLVNRPGGRPVDGKYIFYSQQDYSNAVKGAKTLILLHN